MKGCWLLQGLMGTWHADPVTAIWQRLHKLTWQCGVDCWLQGLALGMASQNGLLFRGQASTLTSLHRRRTTCNCPAHWEMLCTLLCQT